LSFIGHNIDIAATLLTKGEAIAIPTETVYGLAADALNVSAITKVFRIKRRPSFDPLIVHLSSFDEADKYVVSVPEPLRKLATKFMPGPLTLLLEKKAIIPDIVTAGSNYVAVRVPNHEMTLMLLRKLSFPLAAPSANPFGYISPTTAQHVADQLGNQLCYILDGGPCQIGIESTIVGMTPDGEIHVYRKGGLALEQIQDCVGSIKVEDHSSSNPQAPGMLTSHYAPKKPFKLVTDLNQIAISDRIGVLSYRRFMPEFPVDRQVVLSPTGRYEEAARNLFAGMRYLDSLDIDLIYAEVLPEMDLGIAINDRLRRASAIDKT
jgi:L-threonylcarbamoyladenylate synthase